MKRKRHDAKVILTSKPVPGRPFLRYHFPSGNMEVDALYDALRERDQLSQVIAMKTSDQKAASAKGGANAEKKKAKALEWQKRIELKVKRYIAAGKTNENIGILLAPEAGKTPGHVAKFAARLRGRPTRK